MTVADKNANREAHFPRANSEHRDGLATSTSTTKKEKKNKTTRSKEERNKENNQSWPPPQPLRGGAVAIGKPFRTATYGVSVTSSVEGGHRSVTC